MQPDNETWSVNRIEHIFLEKSYAKCGGKAGYRPFYKKIKIEHISGSAV